MSSRKTKRSQKLGSSRRNKNRNRETEEIDNDDGFQDPGNEEHECEQSQFLTVSEKQSSNESSLLHPDQPVIACTNPSTSVLEFSPQPQSQDFKDLLGQADMTSKKRKMGSTRKGNRNFKYEGIYDDEAEYKVQLSEGVSNELEVPVEASIKEDGGKEDQTSLVDCAPSQSSENESSVLQGKHLNFDTILQNEDDSKNDEHQHFEETLQSKPMDISSSELNQSKEAELSQNLIDDQSSSTFVIKDILEGSHAEDIGQDELTGVQSASLINEHEHVTEVDKVATVIWENVNSKASTEDENTVALCLEHTDETLQLTQETIYKSESTEVREDTGKYKEVSAAWDRTDNDSDEGLASTNLNLNQTMEPDTNIVSPLKLKDQEIETSSEQFLSHECKVQGDSEIKCYTEEQNDLSEAKCWTGESSADEDIAKKEVNMHYDEEKYRAMGTEREVENDDMQSVNCNQLLFTKVSSTNMLDVVTESSLIHAETLYEETEISSQTCNLQHNNPVEFPIELDMHSKEGYCSDQMIEKVVKFSDIETEAVEEENNDIKEEINAGSIQSFTKEVFVRVDDEKAGMSTFMNELEMSSVITNTQDYTVTDQASMVVEEHGIESPDKGGTSPYPTSDLMETISETQVKLDMPVYNPIAVPDQKQNMYVECQAYPTNTESEAEQFERTFPVVYIQESRLVQDDSVAEIVGFSPSKKNEVDSSQRILTGNNSGGETLSFTVETCYPQSSESLSIIEPEAEKMDENVIKAVVVNENTNTSQEHNETPQYISTEVVNTNQECCVLDRQDEETVIVEDICGRVDSTHAELSDVAEYLVDTEVLKMQSRAEVAVRNEEETWEGDKHGQPISLEDPRQNTYPDLKLEQSKPLECTEIHSKTLQATSTPIQEEAHMLISRRRKMGSIRRTLGGKKEEKDQEKDTYEEEKDMDFTKRATLLGPENGVIEKKKNDKKEEINAGPKENFTAEAEHTQEYMYSEISSQTFSSSQTTIKHPSTENSDFQEDQEKSRENVEDRSVEIDMQTPKKKKIGSTHNLHGRPQPPAEREDAEWTDLGNSEEIKHQNITQAATLILLTEQNTISAVTPNIHDSAVTTEQTQIITTEVETGTGGIDAPPVVLSVEVDQISAVVSDEVSNAEGLTDIIEHKEKSGVHEEKDSEVIHLDEQYIHTIASDQDQNSTNTGVIEEDNNDTKEDISAGPKENFTQEDITTVCSQQNVLCELFTQTTDLGLTTVEYPSPATEHHDFRKDDGNSIENLENRNAEIQKQTQTKKKKKFGSTRRPHEKHQLHAEREEGEWKDLENAEETEHHIITQPDTSNLLPESQNTMSEVTPNIHDAAVTTEQTQIITTEVETGTGGIDAPPVVLSVEVDQISAVVSDEVSNAEGLTDIIEHKEKSGVHEEKDSEVIHLDEQYIHTIASDQDQNSTNTGVIEEDNNDTKEDISAGPKENFTQEDITTVCSQQNVLCELFTQTTDLGLTTVEYPSPATEHHDFRKDDGNSIENLENRNAEIQKQTQTKKKKKFGSTRRPHEKHQLHAEREEGEWKDLENAEETEHHIITQPDTSNLLPESQNTMSEVTPNIHDAAVTTEQTQIITTEVETGTGGIDAPPVVLSVEVDQISAVVSDEVSNAEGLTDIIEQKEKSGVHEEKDSEVIHLDEQYIHTIASDQDQNSTNTGVIKEDNNDTKEDISAGPKENFTQEDITTVCSQQNVLCELFTQSTDLGLTTVEYPSPATEHPNFREGDGNSIENVENRNTEIQRQTQPKKKKFGSTCRPHGKHQLHAEREEGEWKDLENIENIEHHIITQPDTSNLLTESQNTMSEVTPNISDAAVTTEQTQIITTEEETGTGGIDAPPVVLSVEVDQISAVVSDEVSNAEGLTDIIEQKEKSGVHEEKDSEVIHLDEQYIHTIASDQDQNSTNTGVIEEDNNDTKEDISAGPKENFTQEDITTVCSQKNVLCELFTQTTDLGLTTVEYPSPATEHPDFRKDDIENVENRNAEIQKQTQTKKKKKFGSTRRPHEKHQLHAEREEGEWKDLENAEEIEHHIITQPDTSNLLTESQNTMSEVTHNIHDAAVTTEQTQIITTEVETGTGGIDAPPVVLAVEVDQISAVVSDEVSNAEGLTDIIAQKEKSGVHEEKDSEVIHLDEQYIHTIASDQDQNSTNTGVIEEDNNDTKEDISAGPKENFTQEDITTVCSQQNVLCELFTQSTVLGLTTVEYPSPATEHPDFRKDDGNSIENVENRNAEIQKQTQTKKKKKFGSTRRPHEKHQLHAEREEGEWKDLENAEETEHHIITQPDTSSLLPESQNTMSEVTPNISDAAVTTEQTQIITTEVETGTGGIDAPPVVLSVEVDQISAVVSDEVSNAEGLTDIIEHMEKSGVHEEKDSEVIHLDEQYIHTIASDQDQNSTNTGVIEEDNNDTKEDISAGPKENFTQEDITTVCSQQNVLCELFTQTTDLGLTPVEYPSPATEHPDFRKDDGNSIENVENRNAEIQKQTQTKKKKKFGSTRRPHGKHQLHAEREEGEWKDLENAEETEHHIITQPDTSNLLTESQNTMSEVTPNIHDAAVTTEQTQIITTEVETGTGGIDAPPVVLSVEVDQISAVVSDEVSNAEGLTYIIEQNEKSGVHEEKDSEVIHLDEQYIHTIASDQDQNSTNTGVIEEDNNDTKEDISAGPKENFTQEDITTVCSQQNVLCELFTQSTDLGLTTVEYPSPATEHPDFRKDDGNSIENVENRNAEIQKQTQTKKKKKFGSTRRPHGKHQLHAEREEGEWKDLENAEETEHHIITQPDTSNLLTESQNTMSDVTPNIHDAAVTTEQTQIITTEVETGTGGIDAPPVVLSVEVDQISAVVSDEVSNAEGLTDIIEHMEKSGVHEEKDAEVIHLDEQYIHTIASDQDQNSTNTGVIEEDNNDTKEDISAGPTENFTQEDITTVCSQQNVLCELFTQTTDLGLTTVEYPSPATEHPDFRKDDGNSIENVENRNAEIQKQTQTKKKKKFGSTRRPHGKHQLHAEREEGEWKDLENAEETEHHIITQPDTSNLLPESQNTMSEVTPNIHDAAVTTEQTQIITTEVETGTGGIDAPPVVLSVEVDQISAVVSDEVSNAEGLTDIIEHKEKSGVHEEKDSEVIHLDEQELTPVITTRQDDVLIEHLSLADKAHGTDNECASEVNVLSTCENVENRNEEIHMQTQCKTKKKKKFGSARRPHGRHQPPAEGEEGEWRDLENTEEIQNIDQAASSNLLTELQNAISELSFDTRVPSLRTEQDLGCIENANATQLAYPTHGQMELSPEAQARLDMPVVSEQCHTMFKEPLENQKNMESETEQCEITCPVVHMQELKLTQSSGDGNSGRRRKIGSTRRSLRVMKEKENIQEQTTEESTPNSEKDHGHKRAYQLTTEISHQSIQTLSGPVNIIEHETENVDSICENLEEGKSKQEAWQRTTDMNPRFAGEYLNSIEDTVNPQESRPCDAKTSIQEYEAQIHDKPDQSEGSLLSEIELYLNKSFENTLNTTALNPNILELSEPSQNSQIHMEQSSPARRRKMGSSRKVSRNKHAEKISNESRESEQENENLDKNIVQNSEPKRELKTVKETVMAESTEDMKESSELMSEIQALCQRNESSTQATEQALPEGRRKFGSRRTAKGSSGLGAFTHGDYKSNQENTDIQVTMDDLRVSDLYFISEPESPPISHPVSEARPEPVKVREASVKDTNTSNDAGLVSLDSIMKTSPSVVSTGGKQKIDFEQWNEQIPDFGQTLYNIVMVGNSNVGKTSFIKRLQSGQFIQDYSATIGVDTFVHTVTFGSRTVKLYVWDTAGQERYHSITRQVFHKAQGLLLMYDITSSQSFHAVRAWISQIKENAPTDVIVMLLGNKNDCADREVQLQQGEDLSKEYDIHFMECSVATGENVSESLKTLAWLLLKQRVRKEEEYTTLQPKPQSKKSGCC